VNHVKTELRVSIKKKVTLVNVPRGTMDNDAKAKQICVCTRNVIMAESVSPLSTMWSVYVHQDFLVLNVTKVKSIFFNLL